MLTVSFVKVLTDWAPKNIAVDNIADWTSKITSDDSGIVEVKDV